MQEIITGETPDISEYLDFSFYKWVVFHINARLGESQLGRWLGVSYKVGQLMSFWILPISGVLISCVTVQSLTQAETLLDEYHTQIKDFNLAIEKHFDIQNLNIHFTTTISDWNCLSLNENNLVFCEEFLKVIDDKGILYANDSFKELPDYDGYIDMEINLPCGSNRELLHARVKRRAVNIDSNPMETATLNHITDIHLYDAQFDNGIMETIAANIIAKNLLSQVDSEGRRQPSRIPTLFSLQIMLPTMILMIILHLLG